MTAGSGPRVAATRLWLKHRPFAVLFAVGAVLRLATLLAYWPALEFHGDSYSYLIFARQWRPDTVRPFGYSAFLWLLAWTGSVAVVPAVQHLLGLAIGGALYALALHRGLPRWLAATASAPVLLDAYQVDIEQMVMAETVFAALLTAAILALLWSPRPGALTCAGAGLLLAAAALTRSVGLGLAALAALYLLARAVRVHRLFAFGLAWGVPLVGYAAWFATVHGMFALQNVDGWFLWGRVAPFAECSRIDVTPREAPLCSPHPPRERPGPSYYQWDVNSPRFDFTTFDGETNELFRDFAFKVITAQPREYTRRVAHDVAHFFAPSRYARPHDWYVGAWQFPVAGRVDPRWHIDLPLADFDNRAVPRRYHPVLGGVLRGYQSFGFTPGPLLAGCAVVGAVAAIAASGYGSSRLRHDCLLLVAMGLALPVIACATAVFDYRYMLPTLVCLPLTGALGLHQLQVARAHARAVRHPRACPAGPGDLRPTPARTRVPRPRHRFLRPRVPGRLWPARSSPGTTSASATRMSGSPGPS